MCHQLHVKHTVCVTAVGESTVVATWSLHENHHVSCDNNNIHVSSVCAAIRRSATELLLISTSETSYRSSDQLQAYSVISPDWLDALDLIFQTNRFCLLLDRQFCECYRMFCAYFFFFISLSTHFLRRPLTDILETFSRDCSLKRSAAMSISWKCPAP